MKSLRQSHAPPEIGEARIGAQAVESRIHFEGLTKIRRVVMAASSLQTGS
jgi:hypothetical protein